MMAGPADPFNNRVVHATEMPAANGITTARSLAKMYAATVGDVDGVRLFGDDTVAAVRAEAVNGPDACLTIDTRFGMGFMLDGQFTPMLSPGSFRPPRRGRVARLRGSRGQGRLRLRDESDGRRSRRRSPHDRAQRRCARLP